MKYIKILGTLIFVLMLGACSDSNEPNDYAYVVAIGIDKAQEAGEYEISIQFAKPVPISGGESEEGGKGGETLGLVTVEAPTIYSGINLANNIVSKRFQLAHTKLFVLSEEVAKEGVKNIIYTIVRSSELRPNMYIAVAPDGAKEYLSAVKPEMEINPVKYYQLIFENQSAEFVPRIISQNVYFYMESDERDIVLPIVSQSSEKKNEQETDKSDGETEKSESTELPKSTGAVNYSGFEYMMREYIAGNIAANKKNKSEAMGMALFDDDVMTAEMSGIETEIYNILNGSFKYSYSAFDFGGNVSTMAINQHKKPIIRVDTADDKPKIYVKINMEGDLLSVPDEYILEEDIYNCENRINEYISAAVTKFLYKTSRQSGTDIVGFGSYSKKNFYRYGDFVNYDWKNKYKAAEFYVESKFKIKRAGLIIKYTDKGDTK